MTPEPSARDWLRLAQAFPRLGLLRDLLKQVPASQILQANHSQLSRWGVDAKSRARLAEPLPDAWLHWLEADPQHQVLSFDDPLYPPLLAELDHAPSLLWVKGNIDLLSQPQLAMVGSRNATAGGLDNARHFASHLAAQGLTITSGLAEGVDGAAHLGALDNQGHTIAVTGTGLDRVYPARHRDLAHRIARHGVLISEFPPGTPPLRGNFPSRNRIIAGMSLGVLVVEASVRSGSLITARLANEQGREVLAIPGSIHNPLARGCHHLIRQGARLVETAEDVLSELASMAARLGQSLSERLHSEQPGEQSAPAKPSPARKQPEPPDLHPLSSHDDEKNTPGERILEAMGYDPVDIDTLSQRLELTIEALSPILLTLELDGRVRQDERGRYTRCAKRS